jgi:hypothetical protein
MDGPSISMYSGFVLNGCLFKAYMYRVELVSLTLCQWDMQSQMLQAQLEWNVQAPPHQDEEQKYNIATPHLSIELGGAGEVLSSSTVRGREEGEWILHHLIEVQQSIFAVQFPFDFQVIRLRMDSYLEMDHRMPNVVWTSRVDTAAMLQSHISSQDTFFYSEWEAVDLQCEQQTDLRDGPGQYRVAVLIHRQWWYFFLHYGWILTIISAFGFTSYVLRQEEWSNRLQNIFTLFLTLIGFRGWYIGKHTPSLLYTHYMDRYILSCIFFQIMMAVQTTVMGWIAMNGESFVDIDRNFGCGLFALWVAFHVGFFLLCWRTLSLRPCRLPKGSVSAAVDVGETLQRQSTLRPPLTIQERIRRWHEETSWS